MTLSNRSLRLLARILLVSMVAACGGRQEDPIEDGGGGAAGASMFDASNAKDIASGGDVRSDVTRSDATPMSDASGSGGSGGSAGSRSDGGPGGAAGRGGSGGAGDGGAGGIAGQGGAGNGGAAGVAGSAGKSGASGSGGTGARDGGGGGGGAGGSAPPPDSGAGGDASVIDASFDAAGDPPLDRAIDVTIDAPILCDKPAALGGAEDASTIWRLAGVVHVTSDLTLTLSGMSDLGVLKCLAKVDGTLSIQADAALITVALPQLQTLLGELRITNSMGLTTIAMPLLTSVGQSGAISVEIDTLDSLTSISLPSLTVAPGVISIHDIGYGAITTGPFSLSFGPLTSVGGLRIADNPHLQGLENLANVTSVAGDVAIQRVNEVRSVSFPHLTSLGGGVSIREGQAIATIAFPELTSVGEGSDGKSLDLESMGVLDKLAFPKLTTIPASVYLFHLGDWLPSGIDPLGLDFHSLTAIGGSFEMDAMNLVRLDAFSQLGSVGGTFSLRALSSLPSFAFSALATVGGSVIVDRLDVMPSATFPALKTINGRLLVTENPVMEAFAVPVLTSIGKEIDVSLSAASMPVLKSFSAPSLVSTGGALQFFNVGYAVDAPATIALSFGVLKTLGGDFSLSSVPRLLSLDGFPQLTTVQGDVSIQSNGALTTATLPSLTTVSGSVEFTNDYLLTSISLPALTLVGKNKSSDFSFNLDLIPQATSISAPKVVTTTSSVLIHEIGDPSFSWPPLSLDFTALTHVGNALEIYTTPVRNSNGFPNLTSIAGSLLIYENRDLASVAFPALVNVGGTFQMRKNDLLTSVSMPALTTLGQENDISLKIDGLPIVTSILLPHLATTQGRVSFTFFADGVPYPGPLSLDLGGLSSVGGELELYALYNLQKLDLANLTSTGEDLSIIGNPRLVELAAPKSNVAVNGYVAISSNSQLPTCAAKAFGAMCTALFNVIVSDNLPDACYP